MNARGQYHQGRYSRECIQFERLPFNASKLDPWASDDRGVRYFYNVLWIERKEEIAYRKAAGHIPRRVWYSASLEKVRVVLE